MVGILSPSKLCWKVRGHEELLPVRVSFTAAQADMCLCLSPTSLCSAAAPEGGNAFAVVEVSSSELQIDGMGTAVTSRKLQYST
jgi:hypothetical protein